MSHTDSGVRRTLFSCKVQCSNLSQIPRIRLPHITPDYIRFHGQRLQKENRFSTGLLLTVLRSADPLPLSDADRRRHSWRRLRESLE